MASHVVCPLVLHGGIREETVLDCVAFPHRKSDGRAHGLVRSRGGAENASRRVGRVLADRLGGKSSGGGGGGEWRAAGAARDHGGGGGRRGPKHARLPHSTAMEREGRGEEGGGERKKDVHGSTTGMASGTHCFGFSHRVGGGGPPATPASLRLLPIPTPLPPSAAAPRPPHSHCLDSLPSRVAQYTALPSFLPS